MTKVEVKELSGCTKKMHIEIERERFDSEFSGKLKSMRKDIQIHGFRKGKAPESMIVRQFGSVVREEAVKTMIPKVLEEVFKSEDLNPVGEPEISDLNIDDAGPISFSVTIEEVPDIDIEAYKSLAVTREIVEVTEEDIDNTIERYRQMRAVRQEVDREAREGDILTVNLQKTDTSGVPLIGEKTENQTIYLEEKSVPAREFLDQVVGMKKGDKRQVRFTYDESAENRGLAGETEAYEVEVTAIHENIVPELNDEFAASFGETTDLAGLREKTRDHLEMQEESYAGQKLRSDLIEEFIRQNPFEVPGSMVNRIVQAELDDMRNKSDQQIDIEDYKERLRPNAVRAVQTYLIIDEVKEKNNIEVEKEEITEHLQKIAEANGMDPKDLRRRLIKEGRFDELRSEIAQRKAYDWIIESADITEKKVEKPSEQSNIIAPDWRK